MCNLARLHLEAVDISTWFVEPDICEPHIYKDLLLGLNHITFAEPTLSGGDWGPLTNFLSRRAAVGNQISSLSLRAGRPRMGENVVKSIEGLVEVLNDEGNDGGGY